LITANRFRLPTSVPQVAMRLRPDGRKALQEERRQWDIVTAALAKAIKHA